MTICIRIKTLIGILRKSQTCAYNQKVFITGSPDIIRLTSVCADTVYNIQSIDRFKSVTFMLLESSIKLHAP